MTLILKMKIHTDNISMNPKEHYQEIGLNYP